MGRVYATKVDWWIGLILAFTVVVLVGSAVPIFAAGALPGPTGLAAGLFCLAMAVWIGWIPFNTTYEIGETQLVVRSAGFRWRIPLESIVEVFPTHNPLSSPACSLDRLRVNYRARSGRTWFVMISPREKEDFLRDLAEAVPALELAGDRLVSQDGDTLDTNGR